MDKLTSKKHFVFCSGGKDSTASVILAHEKGEPMDAVVFCEVMFDENISGEHPLHRDFVFNKLKPFIENEIKVPFIVLRSDTHYVEWFYKTLVRGKNVGKIHGFPVPGMCAINRDCKLKPIRQFLKQYPKDEVIQYVGIAVDEPKRLKRLDGTNKVSLLAKYGYTEKDAKQLCEKYGMLSPVYELTHRNGCWFCMNVRDKEWKWLMDNTPDLFNRLIEMELSIGEEEKYRRNITRTETPSEIKARIERYGEQMSMFKKE